MAVCVVPAGGPGTSFVQVIRRKPIVHAKGGGFGAWWWLAKLRSGSCQRRRVAAADVARPPDYDPDIARTAIAC